MAGKIVRAIGFFESVHSGFQPGVVAEKITETPGHQLVVEALLEFAHCVEKLGNEYDRAATTEKAT
jgi:hypothetical protein